MFELRHAAFNELQGLIGMLAVCLLGAWLIACLLLKGLFLTFIKEIAEMQVVGFEALACSIKRDPKRPIDKKLSCFPEGNPNGVIPDKQPVEKGGHSRQHLFRPAFYF